LAGALSIKQLWRYPVKSMLGERCDALRIDVRGAEGDRLYAVRDAEGKLGSGKNSLRKRQIDALFSMQARLANGAPDVQFPDGKVMSGNDPAIHSALSQLFGVPVTLARETQTPHFDAEPIHLVTTASLAWLRNVLPQVPIDERRFRPNLLVETEGEMPVEQDWIGRTLEAGPVRLQVVDSTERCRMVTLAQSELPEDVRVLREIAQRQEACFGVYARVLAPGTLRVGDAVTIS
jgi:uncharacterized protein YcbX